MARVRYSFRDAGEKYAFACVFCFNHVICGSFIFLSQKFILQLLDSALFGSFLFFTLRSIRRSRKQSADQRQTENKKKRIKIWMTGMIFMIHRKPGFLNVKFVDKDFLCLKFIIYTAPKVC